MNKNLWRILLVAGCLSLGVCQKRETTVRLHTGLGDIRLRLYDSTPRHRDNFLRLVRKGFYDSLLFHRVIRDFMVQGGDPDSKNAPSGALLGGGGPGYEIPAEIGAPHLRGALAAARQPDPANSHRASNGSQFFIVHGRPQTDASLEVWEQRLGRKISPEWRALYQERGGAPQLDGLYTVFGTVISGLEVLDQIAAVPRDANDRPLEDIRMTLQVEE
ncbi:MAG: peptidylprolyl isomerase [Saprospirales bacterium]|jgi:cyclophilin family peptidyl-prolyl cis-trans isomerase|nr:peptidylprolyl isomerase [Saprospirales bacterium]